MKTLLFALVLCFVSLTSYAAEGYKVGDTAMDFKLKNVDGSTVSMAANPNTKGYIVVFTCNHCPYAIAYEDRIIDLHNTYAPQGYPVIAINPNDPVKQPEDSFDNMIIRAKEKKFPFPYVLDATQEVASTYGATRTPHVYLLQRQADNTFKVAYIGAIDDNTDSPENVKTKYVENAIAAIQKGGKANPDFTKAIGCTIKWKK
jgi:peroxiredoxin